MYVPKLCTLMTAPHHTRKGKRGTEERAPYPPKVHSLRSREWRQMCLISKRCMSNAKQIYSAHHPNSNLGEISPRPRRKVVVTDRLSSLRGSADGCQVISRDLPLPGNEIGSGECPRHLWYDMQDREAPYRSWSLRKAGHGTGVPATRLRRDPSIPVTLVSNNRRV